MDVPRDRGRNEGVEPLFLGKAGTPGVAGRGPDELLSLVAEGDQGAFDRLYDHIAAPVLGVVRGILSDPALAEEVAQEVLVEVWRSASRFSPDEGSALTWVLTIAHRRAVDRVRSAQAAADRGHKAALLEQTPAYDEVGESVDGRLEREQLRPCLQALTQAQRESVVLAYYRGLTYREVAEQLALPQGTVKARMRDGLIRLRDCLGVTV